MIRQKAGGAAQPRRCCGRPGWLRPCVITNPCRGRFHIGPVCGGGGGFSLPCQREVAERSEDGGLLRREMPLTEGSARFGGAPGGGIWGRGNPPVCGLCPQPAPPLTRGPVRCVFYARGEPGACGHPGVRRAGCPHPAAPRGGGSIRGRIWNPPLQNAANVASNRDGRNRPDDRRAGCPHPAAPRGGANARGRDKSRPYE